MIASLIPGARAVLRRIIDLRGTSSFDEVQQHFADHPTTPIAKAKIGGTLTSVQAVQRRIDPAGSSRLLHRDERARLRHIDPALVEGLRRAFAIADARYTCRGRSTSSAWSAEPGQHRDTDLSQCDRPHPVQQIIKRDTRLLGYPEAIK
ncbi:hypothetical protein [Streptomyces sp. Rer75]|uniref:hypothetical protein n=1 Tax=unclassified Streptomyces TaxID=2593676 RepID=UPI00211EC5B9|nr:hypothetical protein [Streptomyces sp. Rer75]